MLNYKGQSVSSKLAMGLYLAISVGALVVSVSGDHQSDGGSEGGIDMSGGMVGKQAGRGSAHSESGNYEDADQHQQHQQHEQPIRPTHKKDPFYLASEYTKLMLNPIALVKKISADFDLPQEKVIEKVGKGLVVGSEALFSPVLSCIKIIEKVFKADACRLKFICQFGSRLDFMKDTLLKVSPHFFEESTHLRALSYGINGRDCAHMFSDCEPTLKESFKGLKEEEHQHQQQKY